MKNESSNKYSESELSVYKEKMRQFEETISILETENVILREVAGNKQGEIKIVQQLEREVSELQEKLSMVEQELEQKSQELQGRKKVEISIDEIEKQPNYGKGSYYSNSWFMNNLKHQKIDRPKKVLRKNLHYPTATKQKIDERNKE